MSLQACCAPFWLHLAEYSAEKSASTEIDLPEEQQQAETYPLWFGQLLHGLLEVG